METFNDLKQKFKEQSDELVERVELFETNVATTQTKFKRMVSDMDVFVLKMERAHKRVIDMVRVIRAEQLAASKVVSTLVELEFV